MGSTRGGRWRVTNYPDGVLARWPLVLAVTLGLAVLAFTFASLRPPEFSSKATSIVTVSGGSSLTEASAGQQLAATQAQTVSALGQTLVVAEKARQQTGAVLAPDALIKKVSTVSSPNSPIVTVTATAASPDEAQRLSTAWTAVLAQEVAKLNPQDGTAYHVNLALLGPAEVPGAPATPGRLLTTLAAAALGFFLGCLWALMRSLGR